MRRGSKHCLAYGFLAWEKMEWGPPGKGWGLPVPVGIMAGEHDGVQAPLLLPEFSLR
jgi:hypothetical protein